MNAWTMMLHVGAGLIAVVLGVILWADLREMRLEKVRRVRHLAYGIAIALALSLFLGAHWYLMHYGEVKTEIKGGPWPWAHTFFMETKEHIFFLLLVASFYLSALVHSRSFESERKLDPLARTLAAVVVLLSLLMEGFGAIVTTGYRLALEGRS